MKVIIFLLIFMLIIINNKPIIEKLTFNDPDFLELYPKYKLKINSFNTNLTYDNKYKLNYEDLNSKKCNQIVNNKNLTSKFLEKYNIPMPKYIKFERDIFNNLFSNNKFIKKVNTNLKYPLVVKPVSELQSKDVFINIQNSDKLRKIINKIKFKYNELKIEEFTEGKLYRILIINSKIIDILERPLPFVTGNGIKKIKELIEERNNNQLKHNKKTTHKINDNFLKSQNINLNHPVPKNKKIFITEVPSFFNGSNPIRIDIDSVHQDNKNLFLKINDLVNANISGLDFISPDLKISYKNNNAKLIEINDSFSSYQIHKYAEPKKNITPEILENIEKIYIKEFQL